MRVAQIYGYAVCLVAVVTGLIALNQLVDSAFELSAPLEAQWGDPSLASFEMFRANYPGRMAPMRPTTAPTVADTVQRFPDEATLRMMYEEQRKARIASARYHATRNLVRSGLLLLVALGLFVGHWRWLRGQETQLQAAG